VWWPVELNSERAVPAASAGSASPQTLRPF